jgi:hypothetical protein
MVSSPAPRLVGLPLGQAEGVPGALAVPDEPEHRAGSGGGCSGWAPADGGEGRQCVEDHDTQRRASL